MKTGERRARLVAELEAALRRGGAAERTIASVMADACRLDGAGAAAVPPELAEAGSRLGRRVRELTAALERLDRGEYGRCAACGAGIAADRLDVLPTTVHCRACAGDGG